MLDSENLKDLETRPKIRLFAKKLLYACDLVIEAKSIDGKLFIEAKGTGRFGPKKSSIEIASSYSLNSGIDLLETRFNLQGMSRSESYQTSESRIISSINGNASEIELEDRKPIDFLLLLNCFVRGQQLSQEVALPIGNKLRNINLERDSKSSLLELGSKVSLVYSDGKIDVPKFKISLKCEFI